MNKDLLQNIKKNRITNFHQMLMECDLFKTHMSYQFVYQKNRVIVTTNEHLCINPFVNLTSNENEAFKYINKITKNNYTRNDINSSGAWPKISYDYYLRNYTLIK